PSGRRNGGVGPYSRRRLRRHVHALRGRARLGRRAHGRQAEPRDVLPAGTRVTGKNGLSRMAARAHRRDHSRRERMKIRRTHVLVAALAAALCVPAAGVGSQAGSPSTLTRIGKGEGALNLIEWVGYSDKSFASTFAKQTGCTIHRKDANSSSEMVSLMRTGGGGGGGQYDLVSASGDASLRLIVGGDVQPVNVGLIPSWKQFISIFKSPAHNTVKGVHYGVSLQWGPNTLLYNTKKVRPAPTSWSAIYSSKYKGKVTVPDNPIQIADAALYLSKTKPSLGISDPYELTQSQFNAAVNLLKHQHPL